MKRSLTRVLCVLSAALLAGCGLIIGIPDNDLLTPGADGGSLDATSADGFTSTSGDATIDVISLDAFVACDGADFTTDPQNCGRCGHDCVVGACATGVCQPVPVSVSAGTPLFLALGDTTVFWTQTAGAVESAPKDGGNANDIATTLGTLGHIATDSTNVYYEVVGSSVNYVAIDGGASNGVGLQLVSELVAFEGVLYVSSAASTESSYVAECTPTLSSCPALIQNLTNNAGSYIRDVAVDDAGFVFTSAENVGGAVWMCLPAGCSGAETELAGNAGTRLNVAITANDVFWIDADGGSGRIAHCARANCALTQATIAPNQGDPRGIAADGINVYWTDYARGRVLACPLAGCPISGPVVLAEGGAPSAIAIDGTGVFFANAVNAGTIVRVAKP